SFDLSNIKVGVLAGGVSSERDISLQSGAQVCRTLDSRGVEAVFIDITSRDDVVIKAQLKLHAPDVVFIALHGEFGEDGSIQGILESIDIPYSGSGPVASRLAMDKIASKEVFAKKRIPIAPSCMLARGQVMSTMVRYPVVVKPYCAGSSIGVSIVRDDMSLRQAIDVAFRVQDKLLIEQYIEGRELTVGIFKEEPLAVVEIVPRGGYFDFTTKYSDGLADLIAPAKLKQAVYRAVQKTAVAAHRSLGCRHFSRVDIRLSPDEVPYVLEVNSIPGLTSHSLLPLSAAACGISFNELIMEMIRAAFYGKNQIQEVKKS
ncbi:MAG: D-alanine--D-alanine ligase, partial [Candidatus Omnitrophica bacterium]|nr:D-alanine--D-alanine ligase [Candidatus Omnitrophota bacterium]